MWWYGKFSLSLVIRKEFHGLPSLSIQVHSTLECDEWTDERNKLGYIIRFVPALAVSGR